jgi:hypothetical protein
LDTDLPRFRRTRPQERAFDIGLPPALCASKTGRVLRAALLELKLVYYSPLCNTTKFLEALLTNFSRAEDEIVYPAAYLDHLKRKRLDSDVAEGSPVADELKRLGEVADAFHVYKRLLKEEGGLDFSDLINETVRLFRECRPSAEFRSGSNTSWSTVPGHELRPV